MHTGHCNLDLNGMLVVNSFLTVQVHLQLLPHVSFHDKISDIFSVWVCYFLCCVVKLCLFIFSPCLLPVLAFGICRLYLFWLLPMLSDNPVFVSRDVKLFSWCVLLLFTFPVFGSFPSAVIVCPTLIAFTCVLLIFPCEFKSVCFPLSLSHLCVHVTISQHFCVSYLTVFVELALILVVFHCVYMCFCFVFFILGFFAYSLFVYNPWFWPCCQTACELGFVK